MCQNNAARVITSTPQAGSYITLREPHWLPVQQRLEYKIILLTFKCRVGRGPKYLSGMLSPCVPPRSPKYRIKILWMFNLVNLGLVSITMVGEHLSTLPRSPGTPLPTNCEPCGGHSLSLGILLNTSSEH